MKTNRRVLVRAHGPVTEHAMAPAACPVPAVSPHHHPSTTVQKKP
jgi:hypothetical protein